MELYNGRPSAQDAQAKILGLLTPEQLTIVDQELAKQEEATAAKRGRVPRSKNTT